MRRSMAISLGLGSALAGMRSASERLGKTGERISKAGTGLPGEGNLTRDLVDLKIEKASFSANVKVAKTADEMLGTLLDIVA